MDQQSQTPLFDLVNNPADLKKLPREELTALCAELRKVIMDTVSVTGGHLGSGMGVVELTVALHYLYDFTDDRLVWDVGHQCYPHKLLTERKDRFHTLRQKGGLSGFSNKWESEYDAYLMGHAGTAASAACPRHLEGMQLLMNSGMFFLSPIWRSMRSTASLAPPWRGP